MIRLSANIRNFCKYDQNCLQIYYLAGILDSDFRCFCKPDLKININIIVYLGADTVRGLRYGVPVQGQQIVLLHVDVE